MNATLTLDRRAGGTRRPGWRDALGVLALVTGSLVLLPWYSLNDGWTDLRWLTRQGAAEVAPLLWQARRQPWLWPVVGIAIGCSVLVASIGRGNGTRGRYAALLASGAIGFGYLLAQGAAIWRGGYSTEVLKALLPVIEHGQPALGLGAFALGAALLLFVARGLAGLGYFRGDRFVASVFVGTLLLVMLFVFYPVARVLWAGLLDASGAIDLAAFWERLSAERIWTLQCLSSDRRCGVAWNTLVLALLTAAGTTLFGLALALAVVRGRIRMRAGLRFLTVLPIITPPFVIGMGIILLFGRSGVVNQLLEVLLGIEPGRWIYGLTGVLLAQLFAFTPVAFLVIIGVVEGVSPTLEEAGRTLGASNAAVYRTVSFPLMLPGLANAFLVGFVESLADFGNPLILGGNYNVLATEIYFAIVGAQFDQGRAAAMGIVLLGFTLAAFAVQHRVTHRRSFVTVGGKGDAGLPTPLPPGLRRAMSWIVLPWAALTIVIYVMALAGGFVEVWGRDHTLTLRHYAKTFALQWGEHGLVWSGAAWPSLWNTLLFAAVAAPLTAIIGLLAAYLIERTGFKGRHAFEFVTLLSFAVPGTVIGIAYIFAFNVPPIEITGTGLIIVLCLVFRNMPVGIQAGSAALAQIDRSLEEASGTLGARTQTTVRRIVLPLVRPALIGALVYAFVRSVTTISAIVFLVSGETDMATTYIIGRVVNGDYGVAIAYSSVLIVVLIVAIGAIQRLVGARELGRRAAFAAG